MIDRLMTDVLQTEDSALSTPLFLPLILLIGLTLSCYALAVAGSKRSMQPLCRPSPCRGAEENRKKTGKTWWVGIRAV